MESLLSCQEWLLVGVVLYGLMLVGELGTKSADVVETRFADAEGCEIDAEGLDGIG
jgi:hypothetical protein